MVKEIISEGLVPSDHVHLCIKKKNGIRVTDEHIHVTWRRNLESRQTISDASKTLLAVKFKKSTALELCPFLNSTIIKLCMYMYVCICMYVCPLCIPSPLQVL